MSRPHSSTRLQVEQLEAREVPATVFALTSGGRILTFDPANPRVVLTALTVTGLASGERIADIDVRSGTGGLYGRSNLGRLYLINPFGGFALRVGTTVATAARKVGIDFDPTTDQLRIAANSGDNRTQNPLNGSLTSVDAPLSYVPGDPAQGGRPRVTGLAYTNSVPFASSTTLYGIDHARNTLVVFAGNPANGQIQTVGRLGIDTVAEFGFDSEGTTGIGYAALRPAGLSYSLFCSINLATGAANVFGPIGPNRVVIDIAFARGGTTFGGLALAAPTTTSTAGTLFARGSSTVSVVAPTPASPTNGTNAFVLSSSVQPIGGGLLSPTFGTTGVFTGSLFSPGLNPFTDIPFMGLTTF